MFGFAVTIFSFCNKWKSTFSSYNYSCPWPVRVSVLSFIVFYCLHLYFRKNHFVKMYNIQLLPQKKKTLRSTCHGIVVSLCRHLEEPFRFLKPVLRWLNTVLRAVSGNMRDGACFKLDKQIWRRKSSGTQKTISQNLHIKILWYSAEFLLLSYFQ